MARFSAVFLLMCISLQLTGQENGADVRNNTFFYINPFNAGINTIAITWEKKKLNNSINFTGGYIYRKDEASISGYGYSPDNYIIMNTLYAYKGFLFYPGYNHYFRKRPDTWIGVRALFKYMYHDSIDIPWQWRDAESLIRRVQSDNLYVTGVELLFGAKTDFTKRFFYEIFGGLGFRAKFHSMTVSRSYIETNPSEHPDSNYPFTEKYTLLRPTIHLGINIGFKLKPYMKPEEE